MTTSARSEGKSAGEGKLDLVDAACREKLRRLSKEGGIAQNWKSAGIMALVAVCAAVFAIYFRIEIYNATDISASVRGWGRMAYWMTLGLTPVGVLGTAWFAMQATRTAASASFALACPQCKAIHELGEGTASYDPLPFGPKLARSYVIGIWERVAPVADDLDALLKSVANPREMSASTWGSIGGGLSEPTSILPKLAVAAQWMQRPGVNAEPLPPSVSEGLARLDAGVTTCDDGGMKLHDALTAIRAARRAVDG